MVKIMHCHFLMKPAPLMFFDPSKATRPNLIFTGSLIYPGTDGRESPAKKLKPDDENLKNDSRRDF